MVFIVHGMHVYYDVAYIGLAHFAFVVFFVLSGFVIAHTTTTKNKSFKKYVVVRYLYFILFTTIFLTCLCAFMY
ncbi:hypothetical protein FACS189438_0250 [Bacteroidia bacterium]|nr:hypothetical protein FACS189438_0250 [Bacteroidia bacterium]